MSGLDLNFLIPKNDIRTKTKIESEFIKACNQYITYVFSTYTLYRYVEVFFSTVIKATQGPSYL